ncbi:MAG: Lrp/AsnC ligand binding domain-containing protein [candidate division Zixibacteria bacterium]
MSTGAYVLVKFNDREKLLPAVEALAGLPKISKWNAVDGYFNLILKLEANDSSLIKEIEKLDGCSELTSCELLSDNEAEGDLSPDYSYSYLLIETERYQQKAVQSSLEKLEAVTFCSPTSGGCDLVAIVKGETFDEIDHIVNGDIRRLDGILRLKQDRIIPLDRM